MEYYINFSHCLNECKKKCNFDDAEDNQVELYRSDFIDNEKIPCRNYKYCRNKLYKRLKETNFSLCDRCLNRFGKFELSDEIEECCVCFETVKMIKLTCAHKICNECWYKIAFKFENKFCPLCRSSIQ